MNTNLNIEDILKQLAGVSQEEIKKQEQKEIQEEQKKVQEEKTKIQEEIKKIAQDQKPKRPEITKTQISTDIKQQIDERVVQAIERWYDLGRQVFLTKYGTRPDILKILPSLEAYAKQLVLKDYYDGKLEDNAQFYDYLEKAKEEAIKQIEEYQKIFKAIEEPVFMGYTKGEQQRAKPYSYNEFKRDYIEMLKKITPTELVVANVKPGARGEEEKRIWPGEFEIGTTKKELREKLEKI